MDSAAVITRYRYVECNHFYNYSDEIEMVLRADCTFGQTMQYAEPIREHALSGILRATIWHYSNQLSKFEI